MLSRLYLFGLFSQFTIFIISYFPPMSDGLHFVWFCKSVCAFCLADCNVFSDDLVAEKEKNKLLQEEMEATLHDIQNM